MGLFKRKNKKKDERRIGNRLELLTGILFDKLETGMVIEYRDGASEQEIIEEREKIVDGCIKNYIMEHELNMGFVRPSHMRKLSEILKDEILPVYDVYSKRKFNVMEKSKKRKLWKYVVATVAVLNVIEVMLSRGASLVPQFALPTLVLEGAAGCSLYAFIKWTDERKIGKAEKKFFKTVRGIEESLSLSEQYSVLAETTYFQMLKAECYDIVLNYKEQEDFRRDYILAKETNPTTPEELATLNIPPVFKDFLKNHVGDTYTEPMINERFNYLHQFALEFFSGTVLSGLMMDVEKDGPEVIDPRQREKT